MTRKPTPPSDLSPDGKQLWTRIVSAYGLSDDAYLRVLHEALLARDLAEDCRQQVKRDGLTIEDRFGQVKNHPTLTVLRDSRSAFFQGIRVLGLDPAEIE